MLPSTLQIPGGSSLIDPTLLAFLAIAGFLVLILYLQIRTSSKLKVLKLYSDDTGELIMAKPDKEGLIHHGGAAMLVKPEQIIHERKGKGRWLIWDEAWPGPLVRRSGGLVHLEVSEDGEEVVESAWLQDPHSSFEVEAAVREKKLHTIYGFGLAYEKWITWGLIASVLIAVLVV